MAYPSVSRITSIETESLMSCQQRVPEVPGFSKQLAKFSIIILFANFTIDLTHTHLSFSLCPMLQSPSLYNKGIEVQAENPVLKEVRFKSRDQPDLSTNTISATW